MAPISGTITVSIVCPFLCTIMMTLLFPDNAADPSAADQSSLNMKQFFDFVYDDRAEELRALLNSLPGDELSHLLYIQYAPKGTEKRLTPLLIATVGNKPEVAAVLLEKGADPHQMSLRKINGDYKYYGTPLWVAASYGFLEVCRVLLEHGANVDLGLEVGMTPLMIACDAGHIGIVTLLVENGASIEQTNSNGNTALMFASLAGHADVVRFLLDKGARTDTKNNSGKSAIDLAALSEKTDIVHILLRAVRSEL
ncbi:hypothetical protein niasHS_005606 [Heterodera schachtii]|uniref:Ankyrin repeat domain-containing protein n=1 Tax=Heterodera schachtii TaxID=97005 RepID=A0ABD2JZ16_HETSC